MPFKVLLPPPGAFSIIYSSSSPSCSINSTTLVSSELHTYLVSHKEKSLSNTEDIAKNKTLETVDNNNKPSLVSKERKHNLSTSSLNQLNAPSLPFPPPPRQRVDNDINSGIQDPASSPTSPLTYESTSEPCSSSISPTRLIKIQSAELPHFHPTSVDLRTPRVPSSSSSSSSSSSVSSLSTANATSAVSLPSSMMKKRQNSLFSGMLKSNKHSTTKLDSPITTTTTTTTNNNNNNNSTTKPIPIPSYSQGWFIIQEEDYLKLGQPIGKWVGPRDISFLKPMEIKRQETIFELISTERDYIRDLQLILKLFLKPIQKENLLTPKEIQGLFANLEQLLPVNQELLHSLEIRRLEGHCIVYRIADVFLQLSQYFKMYTHYCMNYQAAITLLTKLSTTRSTFHKFLIQAQKDPSCQHLDLASFLLKPVQRLCKYPLLLKEILKLTPAFHRDELDLRDALTMLNNVVHQVNEGGKFREDQLKLLELHSKLIWNEKTKRGKHKETLHSSSEVGLPRNPQRRVVSVVNVKKKTQGMKFKPRTLILLSDAVLLCKSELLSSKLHVRQVWLINELEFTLNESTVLKFDDVSISFENSKAKMEWYDAVQKLKQATSSIETTSNITFETPVIVSSKETTYRKASIVIPIKETKVALDEEDVKLAMQYLNHSQISQEEKDTLDS